jgi:hypothetical protein
MVHHATGKAPCFLVSSLCPSTLERGTFLTNVVSYFIVREVKNHPHSELVENHLLPLEGLHDSPEFSPVGSEAVHSPIPAPTQASILGRDPFPESTHSKFPPLPLPLPSPQATPKVHKSLGWTCSLKPLVNACSHQLKSTSAEAPKSSPEW